MDTIIQNSRSRVIHKSKATEFSKPVHRRKRWKEVKGTSEKGARWHSRQQVRDPDDRCACYSAKIPSLSFRRTTQTQRTLISIRVAVQIHKTQARLKHYRARSHLIPFRLKWKQAVAAVRLVDAGEPTRKRRRWTERRRVYVGTTK